MSLWHHHPTSAGTKHRHDRELLQTLNFVFWFKTTSPLPASVCFEKHLISRSISPHAFDLQGPSSWLCKNWDYWIRRRECSVQDFVFLAPCLQVWNKFKPSHIILCGIWWWVLWRCVNIMRSVSYFLPAHDIRWFCMLVNPWCSGVTKDRTTGWTLWVSRCRVSQGGEGCITCFLAKFFMGRSFYLLLCPTGPTEHSPPTPRSNCWWHNDTPTSLCHCHTLSVCFALHLHAKNCMPIPSLPANSGVEAQVFPKRSMKSETDDKIKVASFREKV